MLAGVGAGEYVRLHAPVGTSRHSAAGRAGGWSCTERGVRCVRCT